MGATARIGLLLSFPVMKKQLFYTAFAATTAVLLTACDDEKKPAQGTSETPAAQTGQQAPAAAPSEDELKAMLVEQLPACTFATPGAISCEVPQKNEDGSLSLSLNLVMTLNENLYARESAPAVFNKEREAVNEAANASMKPESVYLLQIGATTDLITEEDRAAKPLPENLQNALNEMKELADSAVYRKVASAGDAVSVPATCKAVYADGEWKFTDIMPDTAALLAKADYTTETQVTEQGSAILTPEFEESRKAEITEKVKAFNEAAAPYILSREEAARATLTQHQAAAQEEAARVAESEAAAENTRREWADRCAAAIADGKNFAGEWTRGNRFGELTLHIEQAKHFDDSIQFFGSVYDTKLPEACLDIAGRCDLSAGEDGAKVDITIYDGQYDPDQPTAEVYDARDGLLVLHLDKDGKLSGVMTCASWGADSDKAFKIKLSQKAAESKSSRKGR